MPPPPPGKLLGGGSGKDGRPTDLIKVRESAALRETTAALRKELADERRKNYHILFDGSVLSAEKELIYMEHINNIHGLSTFGSEVEEWTRFPMGLLSSEVGLGLGLGSWLGTIFFQESMGVHVLHGSPITFVRCILMTCSFLARTKIHFWKALVRFSNDVANVTSL